MWRAELGKDSNLPHLQVAFFGTELGSSRVTGTVSKGKKRNEK